MALQVAFGVVNRVNGAYSFLKSIKWILKPCRSLQSIIDRKKIELIDSALSLVYENGDHLLNLPPR